MLYVLIKDFNTFIYITHTLFYCLEAFSTEEIPKSYVIDFFKINDKQPLKGVYKSSDLGQHAIYNFVTEERKYCSDAMKKHFNKELLMTKHNAEDFENCTKC